MLYLASEMFAIVLCFHLGVLLGLRNETTKYCKCRSSSEKYTLETAIPKVVDELSFSYYRES